MASARKQTPPPKGPNYQGVNTTDTFSLVTKFLGYRNREDKTYLSPGWMIEGSQNVLIDISGRLKTRKGYTLYGQANTALSGITSSFDWTEHLNSTRNMRGYGTNVQFAYVNSSGTVTWTTIISTMVDGNTVRYTNYWDNTEKINVLLFVCGDSNVYEWSGATTTIASVTGATLTKQGTTTWAQDGFYTTANRKVVINGITYTYTGGTATTTLTGVTPDPTLGGITAGMLAYQLPVTTANSAITSMLATFRNDLIANVQQQIYYGSTISNSVYISVVNNYKSVAYTSPVRLVGEGALLTLRAPVVGFVVQEDVMYISAGKSQWYQTSKTLSADLTAESLQVFPLKTSDQQGAREQEAISHDRNSVVFISNETRLVSLGRIDNIYQTPMMVDYSYPIANDFNTYDWAGSAVQYWKTYYYVAVPAENRYLILNMTDPDNVFWEAPQVGSFSGFSIIDGDLIAHDSEVPQSYLMYDGYSDNGFPINSIATFAYNDSGDRANSKYFNEFYTDGYITANTDIAVKLNFDLDGCATEITKAINGDDTAVVCILSGDASLGKTSLGKHGLGTNSLATPADPLPPYFNIINTMVRRDYYRYSVTFQSYGVDFRWELLSFGPLITKTMFNNVKIKK